MVPSIHAYFRLRVSLGTLPRDENTKNSFAHELPASDVVVLVERDTKHCGTLRISTIGIKSHFCNSINGSFAQMVQKEIYSFCTQDLHKIRVYIKLDSHCET